MAREREGQFGLLMYSEHMGTTARGRMEKGKLTWRLSALEVKRESEQRANREKKRGWEWLGFNVSPVTL